LAAVLVLATAMAWLLWADSRALEKGALRVNVNTATVEQLQTLPGVGPIIARRIGKARPFTGVGDLARVKGISAQQARGLSPLVTVTGETERIGGGSLLERLRKRATEAYRGRLVLYLACAWMALAFGIGWFDRYLQRRRWEGHRRE
jgi:type II secretory pathway component PulK